MRHHTSKAARAVCFAFLAVAWAGPGSARANGYDGRGGILPAHQTTTDARMRGRGPAIYRRYQQVVQQGGARAGERFSNLHPFVQRSEERV